MPSRSVTYEFRGKFDSLRSGLVAAGRSVEDFGQKLTALDKSGEKMRRGLSHFGDLGGKIALGAAAGLTAIVAVTANFEKAMSGVKAATGEGEEGMKALRDAAIEAGAKTAFSASEAAAGIENLAKAGVSVQDILGGGLQGALDLAAAGELEVADAAEAAASAMTQFGLAGKDVPHIADLLAAAAGKAQGEVSDMAAALNQSGLIAAQVGLSIEETTGALGAFASAGLLGSDAGTSFKTMLGALTPNSEKAKNLMEDLGVNAYNAQGQFIGLTEFAGNLKESLAGLTDQQRQAALETIFGSDAVRAASVIYEQGADGVQTWIDKVNDSGFAAEQAETKLDNLAGDFEALKGSLETALIGAGEGSQGPLRSLVQGLTGAVNAFNSMPGPAKNATTALLGVTAVLGSGIWVASKVVNGIADTKQALSDLGIQAGKTRSLLRGLGAAGAAVAVAIPILQNLTAAILDSKLALGEGDLSRELESIAKGVPTEAVSDFVNQLQGLNAYGAGAGETIAEVYSAFGLFGDTGGDKAVENIRAVDESLAALVESGNADQAADVVEQLMAAYEEHGGDVEDVNAALVEYDQALKNAGLRTSWVKSLVEGSGVSFDETSGAVQRSGQEAGNAAPKFEKMSEALKKSREAANSTAREFFNLGDSLSNKKVSLSEWIRDMAKMADALRNFRENAQQAAKKGLDQGLIKSLHEAGPAGAMRMRQLANATDAEIDKANKAWRRGQSEVRKYTDEIGGVPKKVNTDVKVNGVEPATTKVHGLISALSSVRDKTVHITTVFERHNIDIGRTERASGGLVQGPGTGTSDSIPALISNGEYVVKAAAVAKYGVAMFDRLNTMRFADGGYAGGANNGTFASNPYAQYLTGDRSELRQTMRELRGELRGLTKDIKETEKELRKQKRVLDRVTETMEKERDLRDQLIDQSRQFGEGVTGRLTSSLFDGFAGGGPQDLLSSLLGTVRGDTQGGQSWIESLGKIDDFIQGNALQQLLDQATTEQLGLLAQLSGGELDQIESALNRREGILALAGQESADAVFAEGVARQVEIFDKAFDVWEAEAARTEAMEKNMRLMERRSSRIEDKILPRIEKVLERIADNAKGRKDTAADNARSKA